MTEYETGRLYAVTSWRGVDQPAFRVRRDKSNTTWCVLDNGDTRGLSDAEVTKARPLVLLDLHVANPDISVAEVTETVIDTLRHSSFISDTALAKQIAEQTEPSRISEPGRYGVVRDDLGDDWVRSGPTQHASREWRNQANGVSADWSSIQNPTHIRDGIE